MNTCPCCSKPITQAMRRAQSPGYRGIPGVTRCPNCGAVFGQCYRGDSYRLVQPYWHEGESRDTFYYDLQTVGSGGIERRHGWADADTLRIVQVG